MNLGHEFFITWVSIIETSSGMSWSHLRFLSLWNLKHPGIKMVVSIGWWTKSLPWKNGCLEFQAVFFFWQDCVNTAFRSEKVFFSHFSGFVCLPICRFVESMADFSSGFQIKQLFLSLFIYPLKTSILSENWRLSQIEEWSWESWPGIICWMGIFTKPCFFAFHLSCVGK